MSDVKSTTEHHGTSRRTVIRTAAHAAWAVPAIQIAVAAPAFASSTVADDVVFTGNTPPKVSTSGTTATVATFTVNNDGPAIPANKLRLTLTSNESWPTQTANGGWTFTTSGTTLYALYAGTVGVGTAVVLPSFEVTKKNNNATVTFGQITVIP